MKPICLIFFLCFSLNSYAVSAAPADNIKYDIKKLSYFRAMVAFDQQTKKYVSLLSDQFHSWFNVYDNNGVETSAIPEDSQHFTDTWRALSPGGQYFVGTWVDKIISYDIKNEKYQATVPCPNCSSASSVQSLGIGDYVLLTYLFDVKIFSPSKNAVVATGDVHPVERSLWYDGHSAYFLSYDENYNLLPSKFEAEGVFIKSLSTKLGAFTVAAYRPLTDDKFLVATLNFKTNSLDVQQIELGQTKKIGSVSLPCSSFIDIDQIRILDDGDMVGFCAANSDLLFFTANYLSGKVKVVANWPSAGSEYWVSPDGKVAYVSRFDDGQVSVLSAQPK